MYTFFLHLHSGIRWLILLAMIFVIVRSLIGTFSDKRYSKLDKTTAGISMGLIHFQLVLGCILYFFLSPITKDLSFAMNTSEERFWNIEHLVIMILAVVFAQIGQSKRKRIKNNSQRKFKIQFVFFSLSLLFMLWGIPWDRV